MMRGDRYQRKEREEDGEQKKRGNINKNGFRW